MEKDKDMVLFNGIMVKNSKEIGKTELSVGSVYGDLQKETHMKASGIITDNKEKELLNIKIALIKDNFKIS